MRRASRLEPSSSLQSRPARAVSSMNNGNLDVKSKSSTATTKSKPRGYKSNDVTKTILSGLIHAPVLFGQGQGHDEDEDSFSELDFHPPVPESTANLLTLAEEKVKAMSNSAAATSRANAMMMLSKQPSSQTAHTVGSRKSMHNSGSNLQNKVEDDKGQSSASQGPSFGQKRGSSKTKNNTSLLSEVASDPLKWLRNQNDSLAKKQRAIARAKSFKAHQAQLMSIKMKDLLTPPAPTTDERGRKKQQQPQP